MFSDPKCLKTFGAADTAAQRQAEVAQRQEARMKHLEDLLLQQAQLRGRLRSHAASTRGGRRTEGAVPCAQFFTCSTCGGASGRGHRVQEVQPRTFDGENVDHWIVEKWLMHMEKLFRDTFVEERDRVWLATHFLDGEAYRWWLDIQDNPNSYLAAISWARFKELLLTHYFPTSVKRKMEQNLCSLRQDERSVAEYEREFFRLLHCVPFVVRDDEDKARIFERGLRPSIFRLVQSSNLQTYREVVDRALIVEAGAADLQERREALDKGKGKGKRPAAEGASQTHSRRLPRHPRSRSQSRGRGSSTQRGGPDRRQAPRCVICGGPHYPRQCSHSRDRCFLCGQEGHFQSDCPRGSAPTPSSASTPASPGPRKGHLLRITRQDGRQFSGRWRGHDRPRADACTRPRLRKRRQPRMWVAGIILLYGIRVRALFDTGASHSFIDRLFTELHGIPLVSLLHPDELLYLIIPWIFGSFAPVALFGLEIGSCPWTC
uniref:CCHC-type domain-containing protein n=1 Tax=Ananas comosus var. bracteatus TaxID=296719 RepID=A0A6V7Q606_ANACO|nr:unnamed protein product [Ananas comosus var. bracteatus]